jgi:hypothetical protein
MDQQQLKNELSQCKTMAEILAVTANYYDLDKPLGIASKAIVTAGIEKVVKMIGAKPK